uniref:Odorant receptor n=1 Tax=Ceracris kiangsu TaxID=227354 RepID=A0A6M6DM08_CERKI|nr:odorant receptor 76 [Ceracris kiangsu]
MEATDEEVYSVVPCAARIGLLGYWRRGGAAEGLGRYLRGWVSCSLITFITLSAAEKLLIDPPSDLAELTMTAFELTVPLTVVSKGVCFILQRKTIHRLIDLLVEMRRQYAERDNGPGRRRACYLYVLAVQRALLVMGLMVIGGWVAAPVLPHVLSLSSQNLSSAPWQTPLPLWLPVDTQRSPLYECLYLLQTCCVLASLLSAAALDAFNCNMTLVIAAELQVLNDNIASPSGKEPVVDKGELKSLAVGDHTRYNGGATADAHPSNTEMSSSRKQTTHSLVQNIRHHQQILRCISLLETSIKYSIPFQLLNSVTSMCFVLFVCSASLQRGTGLNSALKTFLCMPYLIFETGIYCIYAQEILDQSEDLLQSAVTYEYIEAGPNCCRTLLIFMLMVSSPREVKVSKIVPLSKPTFLQILNGSYTLINLLYHFSVPDE